MQAKPTVQTWSIFLYGFSRHKKTKMAEMVQTCVYLAAAAQQPGKKERFDFVTLHCATAATYYPAIMQADWLTDQQKARLVELKSWYDEDCMESNCRPGLIGIRESSQVWFSSYRGYQPSSLHQASYHAWVEIEPILFLRD